jgi:hypothetical protein
MDKSNITDHFTSRTAAKLSGLSDHMVCYLRRHDIVKASGSGKKTGRGIPHKYEYADVLLLRVIAKLLGQGISPLRLRKVLSAMQKRGHNASELVSKKYLATDGYNLFLAGDNIVEMLESGQMAFAFVLELNTIREEVKNSLVTERRRAA